MNGIKERVHQLIKANKRISLADLQAASEEKELFLINETIKELIGEGLIIYIWNNYYPTSRFITAYEKTGDKLVYELELYDLTAEELSKILVPHQNDPLFFECYVLKSEHSIYFRDKYKITFDFDKYNYFLETSFDNTADK